MRKLQRVQNKVLKQLIDKGSWTYHGPSNPVLCGWIYDSYARTNKIMNGLFDRGIVDVEHRTSPAGTRTEVFTPAINAHKHLRKDEF